MKKLVYLSLMTGLLILPLACRRPYPTAPPPLPPTETPTATTIAPMSLVKSESATSLTSGQTITYTLSYSVTASLSNPVSGLVLTDDYDNLLSPALGESTANAGAAVNFSGPLLGVERWTFPNPITSNLSGSISWWSIVECPPSGFLTDTASFNWSGPGGVGQTLYSNAVTAQVDCASPTSTASMTATISPTATQAVTGFFSPTFTPTDIPTQAVTGTMTFTPTATITFSSIPTATQSVTGTGTYTPTPTPTTSATPTLTGTPSITPIGLDVVSGFPATFTTGSYPFVYVEVHSNALVYIEGAVTITTRNFFSSDAGSTILSVPYPPYNNNGSPTGANSAAGAGHGGAGGSDGLGNPGGAAYDSSTQPAQEGSRGGAGLCGGALGGTLLNIQGGYLPVTLNGVINLNGNNGQNCSGGSAQGAGSGGALFVQSDSITGTGLLTVAGGQGAVDTSGGGNNSGGGGGGIVVLSTHTADNFSGTVVILPGGATAPAQGGQNGIFNQTTY